MRLVADAGRGGCADGAVMEIRLILARNEPPVGTVRRLADPGGPGRAREGEVIGFMGWLGMLRALSELIGAPGDRPPAAE